MAVAESEPNETSPSSGSPSWHFARDPWVLSAAAVLVALLVVPTMAWINQGVRTYVTDILSTVVLLAIAVAVLARSAMRLSPESGRNFWKWSAIGLGAWFLGDLLPGVGLIETVDAANGFLVDILFFLFYLAWILALDARPSHIFDSSLNIGARRLARTGRILFVIGLFAYFIVLPRYLNPDTYLSWVPSFRFYVALDFYLVVRLVRAAWEEPSRRWRISLGTLATALFCVLLTDGLDLARMSETFAIESPGPVDLLYYLPMVLMVVSSRSFLLADGEPAAPPENLFPESRREIPLVAYSLAFPIIHVLLELGEHTHPDLDFARGLVVISWMILLGGLGFAQNAILERTAREQRSLRQEAESHVQYLSKHDALTGLLNRRELDREFNASLARAERSGRLTGLLFIDLDRFKGINDTFGHQAGDEVLRAVAERLESCVREVDTLFRYGGDEFVLVLEGLTRREDADPVVRRIKEGFDRPVDFDDEAVVIRASVGLAVSPEDGATLGEVLGIADRAMYANKNRAAASSRRD